MKYAQLVIGPAGSGKARRTRIFSFLQFLQMIHEHCASVGRTVHIVNLDPAADRFDYPVSIDIKALIDVESVMQEMELGPNGALLYSMEYMEENLHDWLQEELDAYGEDDYIIFDCPGQIELYSHVTVFSTLVEQLKSWGWNVAAVYLLDSQFITDLPKYFAGCLACLSAMMQLEIPHINVLTKVDLLKKNKIPYKQFLLPDSKQLALDLGEGMSSRYRKLNQRMSALIDDYSMIRFVPLDLSDEQSVALVLQHIDGAMQYGEDAEVRAGHDLGEVPEGDG